MTIQISPTRERVDVRVRKTGDLDFDAGALASRHGLSVDQARAIIERCGADAECLDIEARKLVARN